MDTFAMMIDTTDLGYLRFQDKLAAGVWAADSTGIKSSPPLIFTGELFG
jgi:hypothetical protein